MVSLTLNGESGTAAPMFASERSSGGIDDQFPQNAKKSLVISVAATAVFANHVVVGIKGYNHFSWNP